MHERNRTDALVFFGATGDLAYKKIFPALAAMQKRADIPAVPIICVARAGWSLEQLVARARESVERHGAFDAAAFDRLAGLLRYVDGDYNDAGDVPEDPRRRWAQRAAPRTTSRSRRRSSATVIEQLARIGLHRRRARHRREAVRPRPRVGAQPERDPAPRRSTRAHIFRIDHYLGKRPVHNLVFFRFANAFLEAVLEPQVRQERADHDGGELRHRRAAARSTTRSARSAT